MADGVCIQVVLSGAVLASTVLLQRPRIKKRHLRRGPFPVDDPIA
jgi:hypothetical protein